MNTDTCPDCSNIPCDCGIPAGCTPRTDELANRLIPIAENITATTAQTIITQVLIDVLTLTTKLETELAAVTEQRNQYKAALQSADNHNHEIATKLEIVTDQRDRLADALERIAEYQGVDDEDPKTMAIEALQSLNQAAVEGGADE